ncbi:hypothetical protein E6O75_ATG07020 [Venturia nashicola]|uniref:Uncharacterized protein n=1 Tax=Venturia nashicola TaxID=86259 RepID=A0A4Z1NX43_9PEZI|nr:hypothetical protein E6O75_ATG07020 [Venturia nashicola]
MDGCLRFMKHRMNGKFDSPKIRRRNVFYPPSFQSRQQLGYSFDEVAPGWIKVFGSFLSPLEPQILLTETPDHPLHLLLLQLAPVFLFTLCSIASRDDEWDESAASSPFHWRFLLSYTKNIDERSMDCCWENALPQGLPNRWFSRRCHGQGFLECHGPDTGINRNLGHNGNGPR